MGQYKGNLFCLASALALGKINIEDDLGLCSALKTFIVPHLL
jgi:hypothetical protein